MPSLELADFGWDHFVYSQLSDDLPRTSIPVRVMSVQKSGLQVAAPDLETHIDPANSTDRCQCGYPVCRFVKKSSGSR